MFTNVVVCLFVFVFLTLYLYSLLTTSLPSPLISHSFGSLLVHNAPGSPLHGHLSPCTLQRLGVTLKSQVHELKQAQTSEGSQLHRMLIDPAINLVFSRMKAQLSDYKEKLDQAQTDLSAWKFTPDRLETEGCTSRLPEILATAKQRCRWLTFVFNLIFSNFYFFCLDCFQFVFVSNCGRFHS